MALEVLDLQVDVLQGVVQIVLALQAEIQLVVGLLVALVLLVTDL